MLFKAVPPFSKTKQITATPFSDNIAKRISARRSFVPVGIGSSPYQVMVQKLEEAHAKGGSTLLLFPTIKALEAFREAGPKNSVAEYVEIGTHTSIAQRRASFEKLLTTDNLVILGLRSAIFAPTRDLARIYVLDEGSVHYAEQRSPYWNLRDVALLRAEAEGCEVVFFGFACSAELQRLIELKWVKPATTGNSPILSKRILTPPISFYEVIRKGLEKGPVLVCLATKDYAPGFVCKNCRNRARCKCGGLLSMKEKGAISCSICDLTFNDWRCVECQSTQYLIYRSGARKFVEELGKAFPGQRVILATSDEDTKPDIHEQCIVISSYSTLVSARSGYAAVALLDGEEMLSRQFIRAEEELFNLWLKALSLVRVGAEIFLSLPASHPISQAIIAGKPAKFMRYLNRDREDAKLPPYVRVIQIEGEFRSLSGLRSKLDNEFGDLAKSLISKSGTRLTIKVNHEGAAKVLQALKALQKLRSSGGKELFSIKVDPYYL
jgi:primosomal protein N' (replication factor Y)